MFNLNFTICHKFIAAVDEEVQEIRADKKREARFMKEQGITNMVKALQRRGMTIPDIIATIADAQGISEAQKYYEQLSITK